MGGHRDIIDFLISRCDPYYNHGQDGELWHTWYWNSGLYNACHGGHRNIVNLMIEKGANDWNMALYHACCGGHRELVDLMVMNGANDWNMALYHACYGGH